MFETLNFTVFVVLFTLTAFILIFFLQLLRRGLLDSARYFTHIAGDPYVGEESGCYGDDYQQRRYYRAYTSPFRGHQYLLDGTVYSSAKRQRLNLRPEIWNSNRLLRLGGCACQQADVIELHIYGCPNLFHVHG
jgi:hypothetical protein